ncbi:hypothetical protein HMPREF3036_00901 [Sutterella sp. KLE1602]|nr:hypothetical protein HMPREF3036_00901 [Sutterella sp. KLE1602]
MYPKAAAAQDEEVAQNRRADRRERPPKGIRSFYLNSAAAPVRQRETAEGAPRRRPQFKPTFLLSCPFDRLK